MQAHQDQPTHRGRRLVRARLVDVSAARSSAFRAELALAAGASPEPQQQKDQKGDQATGDSGKPQAAPTRGDDYLIGSGDTLQISVWGEQQASVPIGVVRPDGRITVPLIKEVAVAGLTPRQAEAVITQGLAKFITDPNVTVVVASSSKKVYLIGAVRRVVSERP